MSDSILLIKQHCDDLERKGTTLNEGLLCAWYFTDMISLDLQDIPRLKSWSTSYSYHMAEPGGKTPHLPESEPMHVYRVVQLHPLGVDLFGEPN